ncbi:hypothetical protein EYF80_007893 [Liparis tanakae]|uniref:Uncharacterized protein n=1 Tax=Liparis tanakae TaxID=230148 RepID=A0A4Z2IW29_9TELE|nr:hypothetical protein EYF80_007893 [Liparis tanakae]
MVYKYFEQLRGGKQFDEFLREVADSGAEEHTGVEVRKNKVLSKKSLTRTRNSGEVILNAQDNETQVETMRSCAERLAIKAEEFLRAGLVRLEQHHLRGIT